MRQALVAAAVPALPRSQRLTHKEETAELFWEDLPAAGPTVSREKPGIQTAKAAAKRGAETGAGYPGGASELG
jgi:hypothetical protein